MHSHLAGDPDSRKRGEKGARRNALSRLFASLFLLSALTTAPTAIAAVNQRIDRADTVCSTPAEVFTAMRGSFQVEKAKGEHIRFQFRFSAPQGGDWWVTVDDGTCAMGRGTIAKPDATFACTGDDWVRLSNGQLGGLRAYFTGRLRITGSQAAARKLDALFP